MRAFSLLFEMNTLFEKFVGRTLQATLLRDGARVRLQRMKGHAVIDSDGMGRFATKPDIVVEIQVMAIGSSTLNGNGLKGALMMLSTASRRLTSTR